jgi:hypothetical protein
MGAYIGIWVAKLVAHLLAPAALWVRIQTSLTNTKNGRHKHKRGQNTFARQKNRQKKFSDPHS